ncbi:MAG: hypothetical protein F7B20_02150 [Aeropyrum sp.]|nr:hypothetical protein [Aeropyrum sp.]MCE4616159.1 hypothetical protein [Aeropyrum sp.]
MEEGELKVKMRVALVAAVLRGYGKKYVTVKEVGLLLGVSNRTAGRILARLEKEGFVYRYSRKTYRVLAFESVDRLPQAPDGYHTPDNGEEEIGVTQP